jgi:hypothetical protein
MESNSQCDDSLCQDFVMTANSPQIGSFGEAIFFEICQEKQWVIERTHFGRCDFHVDGQKVDVKTSRKRVGKKLITSIKIANKVEGVRYAAVEFHVGGARVSLDQQCLRDLSDVKLQEIFEQWKTGHYGKAHAPKSSTRSSLPEGLKAKVEEVFLKNGLSAPYIIYRTVMFDKESPHNLLSSQREVSRRLGWTVFLVFSSAPPQEENLCEIIAIPDQDDPKIPRLTKTRTGSHIAGLEKVDLSLLQSEYRMPNIHELNKRIKEYGLRF